MGSPLTIRTKGQNVIEVSVGELTLDIEGYKWRGGGEAMHVYVRSKAPAAVFNDHCSKATHIDTKHVVITTDPSVTEEIL